VTYELPRDDMFVPKEKTIVAYPTIQSFVPMSTEAWKFITIKDIHGYDMSDIFIFKISRQLIIFILTEIETLHRRDLDH
jgi:hypothetical protein